MGQLHKKHSYLSLPKALYSRVESNEREIYPIRFLNDTILEDFDILLEELDKDILNGNHNDTFAMAYAGHQFGHFTMLGDGRAQMLGELLQDQKAYDVHAKGSGITPYSRRGDGKATMQSSMKEYLISEAMHHLGIPTSRPLAVLQTNQPVYREQIEDGSILVRVAASFVRIGTFEYARALQQPSILRSLADYVINRLYPDVKNDSNPYLSFFQAVVHHQATLVAKWQSIGFVHGVLNTDNVAISGETIDYGPCAFLDDYNPQNVFSSIDQNGRYSYYRQPFITSWNLSRLAATLVELIDSNEEKAIQLLNQTLSEFEVVYHHEYNMNFAHKLGLSFYTQQDQELIHDLLQMMETHHADFTNTFYYLTTKQFDKLPFSMIEWTMWQERWLDRNPDFNLMMSVNPVIIPRNHLVLEAVQNGGLRHDDRLFNTLFELYKNPFNYTIPIDPNYQEPNPSIERFITYCGT